MLGLRYGGVGGFFDADGVRPFGDDRIPLFHGHPGVGREHLGAFTAAPGEEVEEVFFTDVLSAGRRIDASLAASNQAIQIIHVGSMIRLLVCRTGLQIINWPLNPTLTGIWHSGKSLST